MCITISFSSEGFNLSFSSNNAFFCSTWKHTVLIQHTQNRINHLQFDRGTPYQLQNDKID